MLHSPRKLTRYLEHLGQDVRYALRTLRRTPLFTAVAIVCLALGIATNTTMFSVFDAIVLRPLPFAQPDQLVSLVERDPATGDQASPRYAEYVEWQRAARSFSGMGAHAGRTVAITEGHEPELVSSSLVSASLLPLLGTRVQLGRVFRPEEDRPGAAQVVLLGDALWRRRYAADSSIIGRVISLDNVPYTVVGVMDRGFAFPERSQLWMPIAPVLSGAAPSQPGVSVVARLRPSVAIRQATAELVGLAPQVARKLDASGGARDTARVGEARSLRGSSLGSDEAVIATAMLGATALLLLIACANVANLLLTRALAREREIAVRTALGAGRGRIAAQLLTEAVLVALAACVVALPLIWEALRLIKRAVPPSDPFPYYVQWSLDLPTFLYAGIASVATGVLFGVGPALEATRGALQGSLHEAAQGTGRQRRRLRNSLVVVELALALVLLVGASLFVRTFLGLHRMDLGYDPAPIMTMRFYLPGARYDSSGARAALADDILRRVTALPGVQTATISDLIPLDDEGGSSDHAVAEGAEQRRTSAVSYSGVTGRWFETFAVGVVDGHAFSAQELQGGVPVAVINKTMAATFWPAMNPIGQRFRFATDSSRAWYAVVGVVPDIRTVKLDENRRTPPTAYLPLRFVPTRDYGLMVRTRVPPASVTAEVLRAIHATDPAVPVFNVWTMEDVRYLSFWMYALWATMFAVFGGIALVLATIGVFGVIHYGVAQRTREIGVRVALGAQRSDILRLVLGQAVALAGLGVAVGLVGAFALTRVVDSLLIGVSATDPTSFIGVAVLLTGIAALASYLPARRATRVDPLVSLRQE